MGGPSVLEERATARKASWNDERDGSAACLSRWGSCVGHYGVSLHFAANSTVLLGSWVGHYVGVFGILLRRPVRLLGPVWIVTQGVE